MWRRHFIAGLSGAAIVWPLAGHSQQPDRVRRISTIFQLRGDESEARARVAVLQEALQQFGWTEGRNVLVDVHWFSFDATKARRHAAEIVALAPDVILATGSGTLGPLLEETRTVPIVFLAVADPVGIGYVESLGRPGGNATGLELFEYNLVGKWLELLKETEPRVKRAGVLRDAATPYGVGQFAVLQSVAPSIGVEVSPINGRSAEEIDRAITTFSNQPNGGLIVAPGPVSVIHRDLIVGLAARHKLPTVYWQRSFTKAGGLISYGPDLDDQYRRAAAYIDRILKGAKPADLPVEAPTKYELVINLKTARALALTVPPMLLARADEVIE